MDRELTAHRALSDTEDPFKDKTCFSNDTAIFLLLKKKLGQG